MPFSLGFSPCPNDVFIFEALLSKRIEGAIDFQPVIKDVEQLNLLAFHQELDITKLSFNAYAKVSSNYQVLSSGAALGKNCGPLLVTKKVHTWDELKHLSIAIPGIHTTANLLLHMFAPEVTNKKVMLFSDILDAVANGAVEAGLIIHESRFTYEEKGLHKLADMGELWEQYTGAPLPLGCIAIRRSLPADVKMAVQSLIRKSIQHAFLHPEESKPMVNKYASELSDEVRQRHIDLYVNDYSIDLGIQGRKAIELLLRKGKELHLLPEAVHPVFADELETIDLKTPVH